MDYTEQAATAEYSFDRAVEFAESTNDAYHASLETFDDEPDNWPLYEHADNFGDC